jgi:hypothetical protein
VFHQVLDAFRDHQNTMERSPLRGLDLSLEDLGRSEPKVGGSYWVLMLLLCENPENILIKKREMHSMICEFDFLSY